VDDPVVVPGGLAAALAACQADLPTVSKDGENPHYKTSFVSLDNLIASTRPVLSRHGLALTQFPTSHDTTGMPVLRTILLHAGSGESLEADMPLLGDLKSMQQLGAAITYARRYAWAAVLGVAAEADTDGEPAPPAEPEVKVISDQQRRRLFAIAKENDVPPAQLKDIVRQVTGVESTTKIPVELYDEIVGLVEQQEQVPF
jgi:hypothetical protein